MATTLLFVYGLLKPGFQPPASMTGQWPDRMRGELFDLGPHPAARNVGTAADLFEGFVIEIDENELISLDEFEEVHRGVYRRLQAVTESGRSAWVYEYLQDLSDCRGPIPRWPDS